jgi:hypothetical protein
MINDDDNDNNNNNNDDDDAYLHKLLRELLRTHIWIYTSAYSYESTSIYIHMYNICTFIQIYIHINIRKHACTMVALIICIYIYMCIYTYINIHI